MIKKNIGYLIACLFFVAIIVSACGGDGKTLPPDNSSLYYSIMSKNVEACNHNRIAYFDFSRQLILFFY